MSGKSRISWTDASWNPTTGCTKVSPGCKNCYAERAAKRLQTMGQPHYANGFKLSLHEDSILLPFRWRKPRRIFVDSMSDLFHEDVPVQFIQSVFDVMQSVSRHQFQILTKRSARLVAADPWIDVFGCPENVWLGVSVENADYAGRIDDLRVTRAAHKFLSLEPLLGLIPDLNLEGIDWLIVGGESGPGHREADIAWIEDIVAQCHRAQVPVFVKQDSASRPGQQGRLSDELFGTKELPDRLRSEEAPCTA
jgi:protein gp37